MTATEGTRTNGPFCKDDADSLMSLLLHRATSADTRSKEKERPPDAGFPRYRSSLGVYRTREAVRDEFLNVAVPTLGGRCRLEDGAQFMGVSVDVVRSVLHEWFQDDDHNNNNKDSKQRTRTRTNTHPIQDSDDKDDNQTVLLYPMFQTTILGGKEHQAVLVEVVSHDYVKQAAAYIEQQLDASDQGYVPVQQALSTLPLGDNNTTRMEKAMVSQWMDLLQPHWTARDILQVRTMTTTTTRHEQGPVLVTASYWKAFCIHVYGTLAARCHEKVSLPQLCQERQWEYTWVLEALQQPLPKSLSSSSSSHKEETTLASRLGTILGNGDFVPHVYKQEHYQTILDSFHFHGFVIVSRRAAHVDAVSPQELVDHLQRQVDPTDLIALPNDNDDKDKNDKNSKVPLLLLSRHRLVTPWLALFQEAHDQHSCCEFPVDLQLVEETDHPPSQQQQQVLVVLQDFLTRQTSTEANKYHGTVYLATGCPQGLYVSHAMSKRLIQVHVPTVLTEYASHEAQLWMESNNNNPTNDSSSAKPPIQDTDETTIPRAPLHLFVTMVLTQYPVLQECGDQLNYHGDASTTTTRTIPNRSSVPETSLVSSSSSSVVAEFCQQAFVDNEQVQSLYRNLWNKQVERLQRFQEPGTVHSSLAHSSASGGTSAAGGGDELLVDFEDASCFGAACFRIQTLVKFVEYARKHSMESIAELEEEILHRACGDFTRRIHQYCLSKREDLQTPPVTFSFHQSRHANDRLPLYCSAIDSAAQRLGPKLVLSCSRIDDDDDDTSKKQASSDPLKVIRELFPGPVGQALSQQYSLCLSSSSSKGTLNEFVAHVEEHTMTICGLPFKKLDKKQEKTLLQARRQVLRARLEQATDATDVLELTIMMVYQQLKNLCVTGCLLRGPILSLLVHERKLPAAVADGLTQLARQLPTHNNDNNDNETNQNDPSTPDPYLVELVRECGLSKDIAKHTVSS